MMLKDRGPGWKRHNRPIVLWKVVSALEVELCGSRLFGYVFDEMDDRVRYDLYHPTIDEISEFKKRVANLKPWELGWASDPVGNVPSPWVPIELQVLPQPVSTRIHVIDEGLIQIWRGYGTELTDKACREATLFAILRRDSSSDAKA